MLQTLPYTAAVLRATRPDLTDDEMNVILRIQQYRQEQLRASDISLHIVLDESVLLRTIGSAEVMIAQLEHVLAVADSSLVTLQVARLTRASTVLSPAFTLLNFPDPADPDVACGTALDGQVTMTSQPADVNALRENFEAFTSTALSPASSAELIKRHADRASKGA